MVQFFPWNCQSRIPHAKSHVRSTLLYLDEFLTTVYTCMRIEMQVGQRSCLSPTPIVSPCFLMHSFQTSSTSPFGSRWVKYCKGGPVSVCLFVSWVRSAKYASCHVSFLNVFGDRFGSLIHNGI